MSTESSKEYLNKLLSLDPLYSSAEIVALRNERIGRATASRAERIDQNEIADSRRQIESSLQTLRAKFWSSSEAEIEAQLASFDLSLLPDLRGDISRLRSTNGLRDKFQLLADHRHADSELVSTLAEIVVLPSLAAEVKRRRFLDRTGLDRYDIRRRVKAAKLIRKKFPNIAEMEPNWLREVTQLAYLNVSPDNTGGSDSSGGSMWWLFPFIVIAGLVIRGCVDG